jgi:hypothetical protein
MRRIILPFLFILSFLITCTSFVNAQARTYTNIMFTATLNGAQETPSVTTNATGAAWAWLSDDRKTLFYQITYAQLSSAFTASHFHLGATGVAGGVIEAITPNFIGNTASGSWTNLPDSIVGALLSGRIYLNVHSTLHPGGEIRGQLLPVNGLGFTISLNTAQVATSADTSMATGTGWAVLSDNGGMLNYNVTVAGLTSKLTAAHFHAGSAGVSGGVVEPITFTDSSSSGTWTGISDANLESLIHNGLYVNVHTANYPAGEIRGQVLRTGLISFNASLDGSQETPPVTTTGSGTAYAWIDNSLSTLTYRITYAQLSAPFTASHFHLGAFGVGGGVIDAITTNYIGNTAAGTWANLPDSIIIHLIKGDIYLNVHSTAHPGGEIRGQLWMNNGIALSADLDGSQDTPPVATAASGTAWLLFTDDSLKFQITFAGLSSAFSAAHFHYAPVGVSGGVVHPLTFTDSTLNSFWAGINDTTISGLVNGNLYLNVHSANHPAGEIRGQVMQMGTPMGIPTAVADNPKAVPSQFALSQNYPNPFNPSTNIQFLLPVASKVKIDIYNVIGQRVSTLYNGIQPAGEHSVIFNADKLSSGVYFYSLSAVSNDGKNSFRSVKKMVLLK